MTWKNFFYANKNKLFVTVIIFFLSFFVPFIIWSFEFAGGFLTPLLYLNFSGFTPIFLVYILIQLLVSYHISCVLSYLYISNNFLKINKYKFIFSIILFILLFFIPLIGKMPLWAFYVLCCLKLFFFELDYTITFGLCIFLLQLVLPYLFICIIWKIKSIKENEFIEDLEMQNANITNWGIKIITIISFIFISLLLVWSCYYSWEVSVKEMFSKEALENQKIYQDNFDKYVIQDFLNFTEYKLGSINNNAGRALNEPFSYYRADSINVSASPTESDAYYQKLFSNKNKWIAKREETNNNVTYRFYKTDEIDFQKYSDIKWESNGSVVSLGWLNNYAKNGDSLGTININKTKKIISIKVFIVDYEGLRIVQDYINQYGEKSTNSSAINNITNSGYLKIPEETKWKACFQIENNLQRQSCYSEVIIATNPNTRVYSSNGLMCDSFGDEKIKKECNEISERINAEEKAFDPHRYESTNLSACDSLKPSDRAVCYSFGANGEGLCSDCDILDSKKIIEINYLGNQMKKTEKEICRIYCEAKEKMRSIWPTN